MFRRLVGLPRKIVFAIFSRVVKTSGYIKAIWRGAVLAESDATIEIEGNRYFPPESVDRKYLRTSATHTFCGWKGKADYYDIVVADEVNSDAGWGYSHPGLLIKS